jgi:hypothetical protein
MSNQVKLYWNAEGWEVYINNRRYGWDHHDDDMGTLALKTMLSDLGYEVEIIDDY